jgi:methanogenic corrinoid protein MtbC1
VGARLALKIASVLRSSGPAQPPILRTDLGGLITTAACIDPGTLGELVARLDQLDRDGALAVVDRAVAAGATLDEIVDRLLVPAQVDVGRRWAEGHLGAAEAQATVAIVRVALARAAPAPIPTDRQPVAVTCPEGERHELAAEMITEQLRARGWPVTLIAGGLPASDLCHYLEDHRPAALLLSCTTASGLPGAARVIDAAHDRGVGVIAGGRGFGADERRALRLGAAAWAPTVMDATRLLAKWEAEAPQLPVGRAVSGEYQRFEAELPRVRAAALDTLRRSSLRRSEDIADLLALQDRLDLMLAHLGAAVLVDEGELLGDHLTQRLAFWHDRGLDGSRLMLTLDAVRQAQPAGGEQVHRFLDDGYRLLRKSTLAPAAALEAASTAFGGETSSPPSLGQSATLTPRAQTAPPPDSRASTPTPGGPIGGPQPGGRTAPPPVGQTATPTPLGQTGPIPIRQTAPPPSGHIATPTPGGQTAAASSAFSVGSMAGPDVVHGQVFADLLFLASMSCHAPLALISVVQADGQWSTLSYGVDHREALDDRALFAAVASALEPVEIHDLAGHDPLGRGPLASGQPAVRFVYGIPLSSPRGSTIGVLCILDRRTRELNGRERQAMAAVARQVSGQLVLWRRSAETAPRPAASHSSNRRRTSVRRGPDGARADLMGLRRAGFDVDPHLLRSHDVALLFDVTERTVINWAASDKLASLRTAGGHLRFRSEDVLTLLDLRTSSAGHRR